MPLITDYVTFHPTHCVKQDTKNCSYKISPLILCTSGFKDSPNRMFCVVITLFYTCLNNLLKVAHFYNVNHHTKFHKRYSEWSKITSALGVCYHY